MCFLVIGCSGAQVESRKSCEKDTDCAVGEVCRDKKCVPAASVRDCEDADSDGYCACCEKGPDCEGESGEHNASINPGAREQCDGIDNNCDGREDPPNCQHHAVGGTSGTPFKPENLGAQLHLTPDGTVTIKSTNVARDYAWPSNAVEGTVSRIDTIQNKEIGRYATVLKIKGGNPNLPDAIPPVNHWDGKCNQPSRTTVDLQGNAYVANRAHEFTPCERQGSVSKIGFFDPAVCTGDLTLCECNDRNGDGIIQTSRDLDGDGTIGLRSDEFLGYDDECLLWTVPIGGPDANARAMAIDRHRTIWVGDYVGKRFFRLHPDDGRLLSATDPSQGGSADGLSVAGLPYGAVIDGTGNLWYVDGARSGRIQRIETNVAQVLPIELGNPTGGGYGITIDRKNRVWMPSYDDQDGKNGTLVRFDAGTKSWEVFDAGLPEGIWQGRGVTATEAGFTPSGKGSVWAAFHTAVGQTYLVGFEDDTGQVWNTVDLTKVCGAQKGIGVGMGTGGTVWVVNQDSNNVCRYDPSTGDAGSIAIGMGPYTYSDFTGNLLRSFTAPQGSLEMVFEGCTEKGGAIEWLHIAWEALTPGESSVEIRVANAASRGELAAAELRGPATQPTETAMDLKPLALSLPYLRVLVTLHADKDGVAPTFQSLIARHRCKEDPA